MSSDYATPGPRPSTSSFTPTNMPSQNGRDTGTRSASSSPSPPSPRSHNGTFEIKQQQQHQDDDTSSQRSLKRAHSAMGMEMDIDSPAPEATDEPSSAQSKKRREKGSSSRKSEILTPAPKGTASSNLSVAGGTPTTAGGSSRKTYSTVFSGSKIKHLKKIDGEPLWRKDIQYEFLHAVFHDETPVFTNSYDGSKGHTFADVYIDAMARSSKTSKVLRDKLLSDKPNALNMAMVCLLVNIGRMNTTLNFFPEMRAQLRTYHPIPSLQGHADPNAYKQLQDAPRLKSILKGASEDRREPITLDQILNVAVPRTNPINLCFVLSTYAPKVTQLHFAQPRDFFDLIMRTTLSSKSRARAYLWLNWWYLESSFTEEDALKNPFGKGSYPEGTRPLLSGPPAEYRPQRSRRNSNSDPEEISKNDETREITEGPNDLNVSLKFKGLPIIEPPFEGLTDEQAGLENVDTEEELVYGNEMKEERLRKMADPEASLLPPRNTQKKKQRDEYARSGAGSPAPSSTYAKFKPRNRLPFDDDGLSDSDMTRSGSPDRMSTVRKPRPRSNLASVTKMSSLINEGDDSATPTSSARRVPRSSTKKEGSGVTRINIRLRNPDGSIITNEDVKEKKYTRPLTQHQIAVKENRKRRTDHEVDKMIAAVHVKMRKIRIREGTVRRTWKRIKNLPDPFAKSDDEVDAHEPKTEITNGSAEELSRRRREARKHKYNNGTNFKGPAGLVPLSDEEDDCGEEAETYASALRRCKRRLIRWEELDRNFKNGGNLSSNTPKDNTEDILMTTENTVGDDNEMDLGGSDVDTSLTHNHQAQSNNTKHLPVSTRSDRERYMKLVEDESDHDRNIIETHGQAVLDNDEYVEALETRRRNRKKERKRAVRAMKEELKSLTSITDRSAEHNKEPEEWYERWRESRNQRRDDGNDDGPLARLSHGMPRIIVGNDDGEEEDSRQLLDEDDDDEDNDDDDNNTEQDSHVGENDRDHEHNDNQLSEDEQEESEQEEQEAEPEIDEEETDDEEGWVVRDDEGNVIEGEDASLYKMEGIQAENNVPVSLSYRDNNGHGLDGGIRRTSFVSGGGSGIVGRGGGRDSMDESNDEEGEEDEGDEEENGASGSSSGSESGGGY